MVSFLELCYLGKEGIKTIRNFEENGETKENKKSKVEPTFFFPYTETLFSWDNAKFETMFHPSTRKRSFTDENWLVNADKILKAKKDELVDAGFFYPHIFHNMVICFYCGGAIRSWFKDDDPWIEHAVKYPNCSYLKITDAQKNSC